MGRYMENSNGKVRNGEMKCGKVYGEMKREGEKRGGIWRNEIMGRGEMGRYMEK